MKKTIRLIDQLAYLACIAMLQDEITVYRASKLMCVDYRTAVRYKKRANELIFTY